MARLSRRNLIAGAAAAPLAASVEPGASADPVVGKVRAWLLAHEANAALERQWQRLETKLYREHGAMSTREAIRRGLSEGRAMRTLERDFRKAGRRLDREAARIARMRATTKEGALAKIEMGLKIQCPVDCEDHAWALIQGGFADLRVLLRAR